MSSLVYTRFLCFFLTLFFFSLCVSVCVSVCVCETYYYVEMYLWIKAKMLQKKGVEKNDGGNEKVRICAPPLLIIVIPHVCGLFWKTLLLGSWC